MLGGGNNVEKMKERSLGNSIKHLKDIGKCQTKVETHYKNIIKF